jgi:hypothetical protein
MVRPATHLELPITEIFAAYDHLIAWCLMIYCLVLKPVPVLAHFWREERMMVPILTVFFLAPAG